MIKPRHHRNGQLRPDPKAWEDWIIIAVWAICFAVVASVILDELMKLSLKHLL